MNTNLLNLLGIGFGPSNLALATALEEANQNDVGFSNSFFFETNPNFSWHSGMLIPDMVLQVPFLRDLATIRNPQSPFTFINYLKENNRLDDFINLRTFYPTRVEFHDYFAWASSKLPHLVKFNSEILSISPVWDEKNETIKQLKISCLDKLTQKINDWHTKHVILSAGKTPFIPVTLQNNQHTDNKIIHTSQLLHQVPKTFQDYQAQYRFIIIGSGQSAGEAALYLLRHYPKASVNLCFRSFSLCSTDNSPYVNTMYHQNAVETFYQLSPLAKEKAHFDLKTSNYSVIDIDILRELFNIQYHSIFHQKERVILNPNLEFKGITTTSNRLEITFQDLSEHKSKSMLADAIILATGYTDDNAVQLLTELNPYLKKDSAGTYQVEKDYQIKKEVILKANIYLQGYCEHSHGPSDPTLAILSTRAESILNSIRSAIRSDTCESKNMTVTI